MKKIIKLFKIWIQIELDLWKSYSHSVGSIFNPIKTQSDNWEQKASFDLDSLVILHHINSYTGPDLPQFRNKLNLQICSF